jgi:two-component system response regulator
MNSSPEAVAPHILIVEDNPLDAELTRWSLNEAGFNGELVVVNDGVEAVALMRGESPFENHWKPELVILDLNLRLMDGPEVLQFIRGTPELQQIRVAILSSSPEYIMRTKAAKADCYFSKSSSLDVYASIGKRILGCYWEHSGSNS